MISHIKGWIIFKNDKALIIEVNNIGYKVYGTSKLLAESTENTEASIWTYLAVRENALDLYGFISQSELNFFELLINTVSGVGPKTALGILNVATVDSLKQAIATGDTSHLTKVSGLGKKMVDKIILELKGKLGDYEEQIIGQQEEIDALEALKSLGYSHNESREALQEINKNLVSTSDRVKSALKHLGKK